MWTALDIFIGLALCYALISLFCTAIQEFIAQMLDSRGKLLVRALASIDFERLIEKLSTNFLANPGWLGSLLSPTKQLKSSDADKKTHGDSAKAWFFKRLMTDLTRADVAKDLPNAAGQITERKSALTSVEVIDKFDIPVRLKARLRALSEEARNDVDKVKAAVEKWFGDFLPQGKPPKGRLSKRLMTDPTPENLAKTISSGMGLIADGKSALTSDVAINNLEVPDGLKARLLALSDAARIDVDKVNAEVQKWCGDFLAEVNHWFTRRAQIASLLIGFGVALALNVDTIELATKLNNDPVLREAAVKAAGKLVADGKLKDCPDPTSAAGNAQHSDARLTPTIAPAPATAAAAANGQQLAVADADKQQNKSAETKAQAKGAEAKQQAKGTETKEQLKSTETTKPPEDLQVTLKGFKNCLASVQTTYPIPLGWDNVPKVQRVLEVGDSLTFAKSLKVLGAIYGAMTLTKLIGLLLTAVALSLGSRFWFDTLKTLLALRTGGQPKAEAKQSNHPKG